MGKVLYKVETIEEVDGIFRDENQIDEQLKEWLERGVKKHFHAWKQARSNDVISGVSEFINIKTQVLATQNNHHHKSPKVGRIDMLLQDVPTRRGAMPSTSRVHLQVNRGKC